MPRSESDSIAQQEESSQWGFELKISRSQSPDRSFGHSCFRTSKSFQKNVLPGGKCMSYELWKRMAKAVIATIATMVVAGLTEELVNVLSGSDSDDERDPVDNNPGDQL
jgi:hypothetical protein